MAPINGVRMVYETVYEAAAQRMECCDTRQAYGYEMLARRRRHDGGVDAPGENMALWAKTGDCLIDLDLQMVRKIDPLISMLQPARLFVNVSWATLENEMAFDQWATRVARLAGQGTALIAEVCELTALDNTRLASRLRVLQRSGVGVALDDFGRGRALLERIRAFEWDYCKVPLRGISAGQAQELTRENAGRTKSFRIVCEEVEHLEDLERIARLFGPDVVDAAQGYALHRPELVAAKSDRRCA